jgi:chromosome segregation ATPase
LFFPQVRERTEANKQMSRTNETLTKQLDVLNVSKAELEKHRDALKKELSDVQKELEIQSRLADGDEKMVKELHLQIKRLNTVLMSSKEANSQHQLNMDDQQKKVQDLEIAIVGHKGEEGRLRKLNYELEKQREKAVLTATNWHVKFQETTESIKVKEMEIDELKKKIEEERARLATQQALYEQVRAERNLFGKQHIESQDEIAEMKRKHKIMTHQIEQLQEEISQKNEDLLSEHMMVKKLKLELKRMKKTLSDKELILKNADTLLSNQDSEVKNLRNTLQEAEEAQIQQKKVYDDVVNERDVLGSQLIRRNDELALLYEKIRIQQSTLSKGEIQYRERLDDMRLLKRKIDDLKRQLQIRGNEVANVETLKHEVYHLQRELLQERIKVKALSEELENPMNVHRWRKLEGSDPKAYEMLQKIQTLQKRLIQKTEEVVEKDLLIQEKTKLYDELKAILARQPGPEIVEELTRLQLLLKEKQRQMKAMASELNMFQAQVMEYKYEIERLTRDLQDLKKRYYEQKRREQLAKEAQRDSLDTDPLVKQQQQFHASQPRFVGGGFSLSATQ